MTDSVWDFLNQVSESMQKGSEGEAIGFFLMILAVILLLTAVILIQRASVRKKRKIYSDNSYNTTISSLSLTAEEKAFLDVLGQYSRKSREQKHLLLENAPSFNQAVKKYREINIVDDIISER